MELDVNRHHREQGGFPVDQPIEALKKDHHIVQQLFDRYLNSDSLEVKKEAGSQLLMMLDMHAALEETIFYPRVHELDASLVDKCEEEHQDAKAMMEQLRTLDLTDPECDQMFRQLHDAVMQHVQREEQELFPRVEQANLDLTSIGVEMQAFEASMLSDQARASSQQSMRH